MLLYVIIQVHVQYTLMGTYSTLLGDDLHTVVDKKTFPFSVLQNGTVYSVVRSILRNGYKTVTELKTIKKRLCYTLRIRARNYSTRQKR